jgi:putative ABC transport system permease protein
MLEQCISILDLGIIFGLLSIAVYLTFRLLDFPDLTVDGSHVLGAAISAILVKNGMSPYLAILIAFFCGALSGLLTAFLHLKLKINGILSGILVMTMLYSINLRIMGTGNVSVYGLETCFFENTSVSLVLICFLIVVFFVCLFKTYFGLVMLSVGQNSCASQLYNINTHFYKFFLISLSNALSACVGAVLVQYQGFADISMGFGCVVTALACIMLGEVFYASVRRLSLVLISIIFGSILYRMITQMALNLDNIGLRSSDLKMITAFMVIASIIVTRFKKRTLTC